MAFFLIIGLGSIGKRHLSNLLHAGHTQVAIVTRTAVGDAGFTAFPNYRQVSEALDRHPVTHAFVCTPTASHLEPLVALLRHSVPNIYLEKPISHSTDGLDEVLPLLPNCRRLVVGYDLRFDAGLQYVRGLLSEGSLGRLLSLNAFVGQHLAQWRPHEDYRQGMSASVEKGGGVLLDLVHEFDYLCWLAGNPVSLAALLQHNPEMGIETEDVADVLVQFGKGVSATVHLDYHQEKLVRHCHITCSEGSILWDLAQNRVAVDRRNGKSHVWEHDASRNDRFRDILHAFLNEDTDDPRLTAFSEALISLRMVEAAKRSAVTKQFTAV